MWYYIFIVKGIYNLGIMLNVLFLFKLEVVENVNGVEGILYKGILFVEVVEYRLEK